MFTARMGSADVACSSDRGTIPPDSAPAGDFRKLGKGLV